MLQILSKAQVTLKGGMLLRCQHASQCNACDMIFAIFLPHSYYSKQVKTIPAIYYLSGLTCTDQNVCQKAGPVLFARAELAGVAVIMPDTSPRGETVANADSYDLGQGAGFYVNATQEPWKAHYQMETYVQTELPALVQKQWPGVGLVKCITGHSMGGHGALTLAMKYPNDWTSVSAFAPVCHPTACPWGKQAFTQYLGSVEAGKAHDATELLLKSKTKYNDILIDQGLADEFLAEQLLLPDLEAAAATVGQKLTVRRWEGMDHSYYFIAACIADHIDFHAQYLNKT